MIVTIGQTNPSADAERAEKAEGNHVDEPPQPTTYPLPPGWNTTPIGNVTSATAESPERSRFDLHATTDVSFTNGTNIFFRTKPIQEKNFALLSKKWNLFQIQV